MSRSHPSGARAHRWSRRGLVGLAAASIVVVGFAGAASADDGGLDAPVTAEAAASTGAPVTTAAPMIVETDAPAAPDTTMASAEITPATPAPSAPDTTDAPATTSPCDAEQTLQSCTPDARIVEAVAAPAASGIGEPAFFAPPALAAASTAARPATTSPAPAAGATLPETGSATGIQLAVALAALGAGTGLVVVARRRRELSSAHG